MRKCWTQDEIEILKEYYPTRGSKYCSELLGRSRDAVKKRAGFLGIDTCINRQWSKKEDEILKQCYIKYGVEYCGNLLNRTQSAVYGRSQKMGLSKKAIRWNKQEIDLLRRYYPDCGSEYCANLINKKRKAIIAKAVSLKLRTSITSKGSVEKIWRDDEDTIVRKYYPTKGGRYCTDILNRSHQAVRHRANLLDIETDIVTGGLPQKRVIKHLSDNKVLARCKKHGETPHYLQRGKISGCVQCNRQLTGRRAKTDEGRARSTNAHRRYRSTLIGGLAHRLRSSLGSALKSKGLMRVRKGCFRLLSYSPKEFARYIEEIRLFQNNQCPMCQLSYNTNPWTIDHIIPIKTAKNEKEVLGLFALNNLSLLCQSCNSSKGAKVCH